MNVTNIQYQSSQPWPFPASLMLAFTCETKEHSIRLIDEELEDARWFSAKELRNNIEKGSLKLPYSVSVSWHLINSWYQKQTQQSLDDIAESF